MNKKQAKEFEKRYDKFKKNNLPTPFWDDERQTFEYVYFYNGKSIINFEEAKDQLEVNTSLTDALGEIANTGFYYPFTSKYMTSRYGEREIVVGHNHAHSFEEVVRWLYDSPESFSISKEEEEFYSKQELKYLKRVQNYLLFIGMKDLETKAPVSRYRNKKHSKYENVMIYRFGDKTLEYVLSGKRNFRIIEWYPEFRGPETYAPKQYQALVVAADENFRLLIEFTHEEVKTFKEVKALCPNTEFKKDDKVIVCYFGLCRGNF